MVEALSATTQVQLLRQSSSSSPTRTCRCETGCYCSCESCEIPGYCRCEERWCNLSKEHKLRPCASLGEQGPLCCTSYIREGCWTGSQERGGVSLFFFSLVLQWTSFQPMPCRRFCSSSVSKTVWDSPRQTRSYATMYTSNASHYSLRYCSTPDTQTGDAKVAAYT